MNELLLFFLPVCINIRLGDALIEREKADEWNKTHSLSRNKTDGKKEAPSTTHPGVYYYYSFFLLLSTAAG